MATKVFKRDAFIIVIKDAGPEISIPPTSFDYSLSIDSLSVSLRDNTENQTIVDLVANIQDESGTPIGNAADVSAYLANAATIEVGGEVTVVGGATEVKQDTQITLHQSKAKIYAIQFGGGAKLEFPDDIVGDFTFNYFNKALCSTSTYTEDLDGVTVNDFAELITLLNTNQTFFEFYQLSDDELSRLPEYPTCDTYLGIRSNTLNIPSDYITGNFNLEFASAGGSFADPFIVVSNTPLSVGDDINDGITQLNTKTDQLILNQDNPILINSVEKNAANVVPVAESTILGNYLMDFNNIQALLDRKGTGTQVYANGANAMSVGVGQYAVCQSFQTHPYFTGKSHEIEITFDNFQNQTGVVKKVGYFTSTLSAPYTANYDGFYLEADGTNYNIVIANMGAESKIPKASWDNPNIALNFTNFTVMKIDFLYLGGTSVRFFFKTQNGWELAHTYNHANVFTGTICGTPTLPVRWEIRSSTGTGVMNQVCASVNTAGQKQLVGNQLTTPVDINEVDANNVGTKYLLDAIRLKDPKKVILSIDASVLSTTNDNVFVSLTINPTIANEPVWTEFVDDYGQALGIEYIKGDTVNAHSNTTMTGGVEIWGDFIGNLSRKTKNGIDLTRNIGFSLDALPDKMALGAMPLIGGSNANLHGNLTFTTN